MKKAKLVKLHGAMPEAVKKYKGKTGIITRETEKECLVTFTPLTQRRGGVKAWIKQDYLEVFRPASDLLYFLSSDPPRRAYQLARLKDRLIVQGLDPDPLTTCFIPESIFLQLKDNLKKVY